MRVYVLALCLLGLLNFANAVFHPFVHDDIVFIVQNPHIARLDLWMEAFLKPQVEGGINLYYRPVLEIFYRLEYACFGFYAPAYHLINILLHCINGVFVFLLLLRLGLVRNLAWMASALFLVHPLQTEAVACVAGVSNLLMATGVLSALYCYASRRYLGSLLLFIFSFFCKEQAILFLPLVFVIDLKRDIKNIKWWGIFIAVACGAMVVRQVITGSSLLRDILQYPQELILRVKAIPQVLLMDLRLIILPYDLHYYRSTDILQPQEFYWLGFGILALGAYLILRRCLWLRPWGLWGIGWFIASLGPVLNIVPLINEYSLILTAEHFLYLPMIGIVVFLLIVGQYYCSQHLKIILSVIILSSCIVLSWYQNQFWSSEKVLFERMAEFEPHFGRGQILLAKAYAKEGLYAKARQAYLNAFEIIAGYQHKASNEIARNFYSSLLQSIDLELKHLPHPLTHNKT